jgi:hypothetical protein
MKIAKWSDGYVLDIDPRREDPLFYYVKDGAWGTAIGFAADTLYEEHRAREVVLQVWEKHAAREASLEEEERKLMYVRAIPALTAHFKNWQRLTIRGAKLAAIRPELTQALGLLNFRVTSPASDAAFTYEKEPNQTPEPPSGLRFAAAHLYRSAKKMKLSKALVATSIGVFLLSLMLPGFHYAGADPSSGMAGIQLVAIGWVAVAAGIFAWLGNPLLLTAWVCFFLRKTALSATFSALAMLAMLEFLIHLNEKLQSMSNSPPSTIAACGPGYYLWLASSVLMLGAAVVARLRPKEAPNSEGSAAP